MKYFVYRQLNPEDKALRLLRVSPSLYDGYISCDLVHASRTVSYKTLSYTWGADNNHQTILINGCRFRVRCNLWTFLRLATHNFHEDWLWIDAICINQEDITERNHHVREMADIYERSIETFIWLGPCSVAECTTRHASNDILYGCARDLEAEVLTLRLIHAEIPRLVASLEPESFPIMRPRTLRNIRYLTVILSVLYQIFSHPYWSRLWIVQEIILSPRKRILAPNFSISWHLLEEWLDVHTQIDRDSSMNHYCYLPQIKSHEKIPELDMSALMLLRTSLRCAVRFGDLKLRRKPYWSGQYWSDEEVERDKFTGTRTISIGKVFIKRIAQFQKFTKFATFPFLPEPEVQLSECLVMLRDFARAECSDSRDRIYGLLALSPALSTFPVNYNFDVLSLYHSCCTWFHPLVERCRPWSLPKSYTVKDYPEEIFLRQFHISILDLIFGTQDSRVQVKRVRSPNCSTPLIPEKVLHMYTKCDACHKGLTLTQYGKHLTADHLIIVQCSLGRNAGDTPTHVLIFQHIRDLSPYHSGFCATARGTPNDSTSSSNPDSVYLNTANNNLIAQILARHVYCRKTEELISFKELENLQVSIAMLEGMLKRVEVWDQTREKMRVFLRGSDYLRRKLFNDDMSET